MGLADDLALLTDAERAEVLSGLTAEQLDELFYTWSVWARPDQLAPAAGNDGTAWHTWLALAGRGWGKTRVGSEWVRGEVCGTTPLGSGRRKRIAIIGETSKDVRDVLIEGDSGLLASHPKDFRPIYQPSKGRVVWPNGAIGTLYNGTEPDQLRGPQFDGAWVDELAKYRYARESWDMLQFGLRLGDHPRAVVTTTPRPIALLKEILADAKTAVTRGRTYDNAENLAATFLAAMRAKYEGTRLGRQELEAAMLDDVPNALWRRSALDDHRKGLKDVPTMQRIVVAVDPAAKAKENQLGDEGAETGIITSGLGADGRGYVLGDDTTEKGPNDWGRLAVASYHRHQADAIVAETNQGGDMVEYVIRSIDPNIKVIKVTASRGKVTRAEPISALYEQGRISHVGSFPQLEDQMCNFTNVGIEAGKLADRVDALVWGMTQLFPALVEVKREPWKDRWGSGGRRQTGSWMGR